MYRLWEEFWWSKITGPHLLIEEVSNALYENKIVFLQIPADLPWRHAMRNEVRSSLSSKTQDSDLLIEQIDAADDNPENMEPESLFSTGLPTMRRYGTAIGKSQKPQYRNICCRAGSCEGAFCG